MRNKNLYVAIIILIPIFIVSVMGFMQGTWFDAENLMERPDIEVYVKPKWQYIVYFSTLLALLCLQALFIRLYLRRSGSRYKYAFVITAATVTILLCIIETYMIN